MKTSYKLDMDVGKCTGCNEITDKCNLCQLTIPVYEADYRDNSALINYGLAFVVSKDTYPRSGFEETIKLIAFLDSYTSTVEDSCTSQKYLYQTTETLKIAK